jgi:hypothetical protein
MVMIPDDDSTENPAGDEPFPPYDPTMLDGLDDNTLSPPPEVASEASMFDTLDDDDIVLPIRESFRTPDEWARIYGRLPRLLAALQSVEIAMDRLYEEEPPDDAPADVNWAFETAADVVTDDERKARDALITWFASWANEPAAVILPDGRVVVHCMEADGLAIVPADRVHKLA